MARFLPLILLAATLAACGGSTAATSIATSTPSPSLGPTATPPATATPRPSRPTPTPTVVLGRTYSTFVHALCAALSHRDTGTVMNLLPHYEYNSGVRYGYLGDGEGQTGDPSLLGTWLANTNVQCILVTPGTSGHGVVLSRGWQLPGGPWSLIEMDIFDGQWKINDFTFGGRAPLYAAMHVAGPILPYHG